jgi:hypothetical protein
MYRYAELSFCVDENNFCVTSVAEKHFDDV